MLTTNTINSAAFLAGYMLKESGMKVDALKYITSNAALLSILAPITLGAGVGALHSKMTSPGPLDQQTMQKKIQSMELEEYRTELERRKSLAKKMGINETKPERAIRI